MKTTGKILLIFHFTFSVLNGFAQKDYSLTASKIDSLSEAYHKVTGFSGTVKVVISEEEVFEKSYGLSNRSFEVPFRTDTRNSINSISKTFTALACVLLSEEGKLDLQAAIGTYLPDLNSSWKDSVSVHQLLTHSSGLPREAGLSLCDELSFEEQRAFTEKLSLDFSPGEHYGYSNAGFILLGNILQNTSGMKYEKLIEDKIINPLSLRNTGVYTGRNFIKRQAQPYRMTPFGPAEARRSKTHGQSAGGGMYSTPADLYRYVLALEDQNFLSEKGSNLLFGKHIENDGEFEAYAWSLKSFGNEQIRFASGSGFGTKSVLIRSPKEKNFIAIVSNYGSFPILDMLRDIFLLTKGHDVNFPDKKQLASPEQYSLNIGTYRFDKEEIRKRLSVQSSEVTIQVFEGKLFMNDEVLFNKDEGKIGLSYTDEVIIHFEGSTMIININGHILKGIKRN